MGAFVSCVIGFLVVVLLVVAFLVVVFLVVVFLVVVLLVVVLLVVVPLVVVLWAIIAVLCVAVNFTGQDTWLHLLLSVLPPLHLLPPPDASVLTLLILTCSPPPHDWEHSLHSPYLDQTQFLPTLSEIIIYKKYKKNTHS